MKHSVRSLFLNHFIRLLCFTKKLNISLLSSIMLIGFFNIANAASIEVIATGIDSAENALVLNKDRILITSQDGVYDLRKKQNVWEKTLIPAELNTGETAKKCFAVGITQFGHTAYTVCDEGFLFTLPPKRLFAIDTLSNTPKMREVARVYASLPNGLTSDNSGNLYLAESGRLFMGGSVVKLTPNQAGTELITQKRIRSFMDAKPNGIQFKGNRLYVSFEPPWIFPGTSRLKSFRLNTWGLSDEKEITTSMRFIDDFSFTKKGIIFAEYFANQVVQLNEKKERVEEVMISSPTSVYDYPESDQNTAVVVTQRNKDQVAIIRF